MLHDTFEVSHLAYASLCCQFAQLDHEREELAEPKLLEEPMPPVSYFFNVQLNLNSGLKQRHPIRKLLEKVLEKETITFKTHAFQKCLNEHRCVMLLENVVQRIERSGIANVEDIGIRNFKTGMRTSPATILLRMKNGIRRRKKHYDIVQVITSELPGLGIIEFLWIDNPWRNWITKHQTEENSATH